MVPVEAVVSPVPGTIVGNPHGQYAEEESPTFLHFCTQSQHFVSTLQVDQDKDSSCFVEGVTEGEHQTACLLSVLGTAHIIARIGQ